MPDPAVNQAVGGLAQKPSSNQMLMQILQQQQQLMAQLTQQVSATQQAIHKLSRDETVLDSLSNNLTEFVYDPEQGSTFDSWYARYADLFDKDAEKLDDAAKVRLLMRKLNPQAHERFTSFILPKLSKELSFSETIGKLKTIFGSPVSAFHRRYLCLQTIKDDSDDLVSYSCKVNKACVDFKLKDMSEEQFKCLIFVSGLKSARDSDIRMRLITKLNETKDVSLEQVVEDCKNLLNLKQDNSLVEKQQSFSAVNAIHKERHPKPNHKHWAGKSVNSTNLPKTPCWACGAMHFSVDCTYREHQCRECKKKGHKEGYCACFTSGGSSSSNKKKKKKSSREVKIVSVNNITQSRKYSEIEINQVPVRLQIDSASDITIISDQCWRKIGEPQGTIPSCNAKSASGGSLHLAREFWCDVKIGSKTKRGLCRVAPPDLKLNILGSDWIELFGLWDVPISSFCNKINNQSPHPDSSLQAKFPKVFSSEMGLCSKTKIRLTLKGEPKPVYRPKRPVAYSVQGAVEDELQRLQNLGILESVDHSDWAAPIVVVRKPNGRVRICADFSTGLNEALESNQCPLPLPEDIFTKMAGCKVFSHIDLSDAYLQVEVDPRDQHLLTVNTHKGLFRYTRLTPGIKSAPGAFQQIMDAVLSGIGRACGYLDDVLVGGHTKEEHDRNLHQVLQRLEEYGFTIRMEKCKFHMQQVEYLGQVLDGEGIRPDPEKTSAISTMPPPRDVSSLRSYLGAVNYYAKYIPEMRKLRYPMDQLLKTGAKWNWSEACQRSFHRFCEILQSPLALTHYNPKMEIIVSADASNYGIGARIAHKLPDGSVKPVSYASRSLTPAEANYSQIEKEGLALIFAVTRFHRMIFGRNFVLETDHKPLLAIFGSKTGIPVYTANRLQRWALTLLLYDFSIKYVNTNSFGYADILSRLINTHVRPNEEYVIASIELEDTMQDIVKQSVVGLPVTFKMIQAGTQSDAILKQVKQFVDTVWPTDRSKFSDSQLQQFHQRRDSLSIVSDCLVYGERLVIPAKFRDRILRVLHKGHPGVERMRSIARSYVYWPGIDEQISQRVRACVECSRAAKTNTKTNLESWPVPEKPWQRLHADYAGPVDGNYYLIVVDAFSKWPEVISTKRITASATVAMFREIFARNGMPETLVTDNGTQFASEEFETFCSNQGILHLRTPPYHPQSNGLAERFVDTFKRGLRKITTGGEPLREAIDTFLLCYRSTPCRCAPDGKSPAELLLGRRLRTALDLLKPPTSFYKQPESKQEIQFNRKHGTKALNYDVKDLVWTKVHRNNTWSWEPGQILERIGRVIYNVWLSEKRNLVRSHTNQLRKRYESEQPTSPVQQQSTQIPLSILLDSCGLSQPSATPAEQATGGPSQLPLLNQLIPTEVPRRAPSKPPRATTQQQSSQLRQSSRVRRTPVRRQQFNSQLHSVVEKILKGDIQIHLSDFNAEKILIASMGIKIMDKGAKTENCL
ncbi:uncharacterized protein K02A2.6-like [Uranotaenia lowii]|uniref:uncharacterized protein K02A2.6-like n=1 Tax=Uranotaenia lowii TaxID=190385 RepID=UPI002478846A|nr:uncharacterized protein K02A2.6-like [Uranotaenia lowii]